MNRLAWISMAIIGALAAAGPEEPYTAKVVGVSDGDTLTVRTADGREVKVRLYGIDAPEIGQDFGAKAKEYASELALGKEVTIKEPRADDRGLIIAKVILPDGEYLNFAMLDRGMAWRDREATPNDTRYFRAEHCARRVGYGLWSQPNPTPPWKWRERR